MNHERIIMNNSIAELPSDFFDNGEVPTVKTEESMYNEPEEKPKEEWGES